MPLQQLYPRTIRTMICLVSSHQHVYGIEVEIVCRAYTAVDDDQSKYQLGGFLVVLGFEGPIQWYSFSAYFRSESKSWSIR